MGWLAFLLIGFGAFLIGNFGFSQIIGCIKYPYAVRTPGATIALWVVVLVAVAAVAHWLAPADALIGFYIGYVISFILSLRIKPD